MGEPRPRTPDPAGSTRQRRNREALERLVDSPLSAPASIHGERNIRRRIDFDPRVPSTQLSQMFEFHVYLPNRNSVMVRVSGEKCESLTVQEFVRLVRSELNRCSDGGVKQKQRGIVWGDHVYIENFQEQRVQDREFTSCHESKTGRVLLLYDGQSDTVHAHSDFWNVTPEPQILGVLPQDYTLFSALADEVDNSLQAVFQLEAGKQRLICVNLDHTEGKISIYDTGKGMDGTPENCISKWGTIGSSMNRHSVVEAIGGQPPYLKPNFGMYGFGGIGAGLHLGGIITVSSKTEASHRVAILHLGRESLTATVKAGSVWKTGGEFRSPTEQELQWSPHGSFTKVEISDFSRRVATWKVEEVQRKLKDYYFPYIQNDEGDGGMTDRPVEIRVNGEDLAGVVGGEVAHSNFYSSRGEPFVITLEFTKRKDTTVSEHAEVGFDKANARITCHYFPINKGREAIDDILEKLREEDSDFAEDFESFSRRSIRRLGRLLPDAGRMLPDDRSAGRLPFMEPKKYFRANEVNRHCYKRVKAFIDVDAGFVPTTSKMDLVPKHPFTKALLELGLGLQTEDSAQKTLRKPAGPVTVSITRGGAAVRPQDLHADYTTWITKQTEKFDTAGVISNESDTVIIVTEAHNKKELHITKDAFQVVYDITSRGTRWKVGKDEGPIRLKLQKGLPGLNSSDMPLLVTVECFISDGLPDDPGATKIICRPMEVPEERGSKVEGANDRFILGESRVFPIEILFDQKVEKVDEFSWLKRLDVTQSRLPAFVELLNDQEVSKLAGHKLAGHKIVRNQYTISKAGAALPTELIAVVRTNSCTSGSASGGLRLEKKDIFQESMEMTLVVQKMKYHPQGLKVQVSALENAENLCQMKMAASKRGDVSGLYCFKVTGTSLERLTTTGTYIFSFTVVGVKYEVKKFRFRIDITPSSKIGHWKICSHSGICSDIHPNRNPEVMEVRLGEVLPGTLYLTRVDEFSNSMEFTRIPTDIGCGIFTVGGAQVEISIAIAMDLIKLSDDHLSLEIPRIKVDGGELALFKPTMQAVLKINIDGILVADFLIAVLPGRIASARMKESRAPLNCLQPGQVIEHIVFEGLDNFRNPVSSGEKIKVLLEGLELQDKIEYQRSVGENGCLDLGMRLRVTAGYGETARVELRSTEDSTLWESTFDIINRKLRIKNDIPENVAAGSLLKDIVIEAVDEDGQVDNTMDGTAHALTLDWNPNIAVPLQQGRCTLPPIQFPCSPGELWKGCVAHTRNPEVHALITVRLEEPERDDNESMASENPCSIPESSETPAARPRHPESRVIVASKQVIREVRHHSELHKLDETALQRNEMEKKAESLSRKTKKLENKLAGLNRVKKDFRDAMERYNNELEEIRKSAKFEVTTTREVMQEQPVEESLSPFACTAKQMAMEISKLGNPPGTHAATILLQAKREQYSGFKDVEADIIGIVALLATVDDEGLNRALVEFLGIESMLAIICGSKRAAECLGIPHSGGTLTKSPGLSGYAKSRNLHISGRFRVIALTDESSFFKGSDGKPAANSADQQKLLNIEAISKPGSERLVGSLGYAVNLISLNERQLGIRVLGQYGLRESLFFVLFGYLEVFDTTNNMLRARSGIRSTAVSLDGGLIRARNQFEMGSREDPVVWFPAAKQPNAGPKQNNFKLMGAKSMKPRPVQLSLNAEVAKKKEAVMRIKELAQKIYNDGGTEADIQKTKEKLMKVNDKTKQLQKDFQTLSQVSKLPEDGDENQQALAKFMGRRAVAQVFINGEHIGGSDDTVAAEQWKAQEAAEGLFSWQGAEFQV